MRTQFNRPLKHKRVFQLLSFLLPLLYSITSCQGAESSHKNNDPYGLLKTPLPDKTVVLTFDDGCKSDLQFVAPLLKKYGFKATFYITEGMGFKSRKDWYLTWDEIKSVEKMGFEIGNHTIHHWGLGAHTLENCLMTTEGIEELFTKHQISKPSTFCWPFYSVNNQFIPLLSNKGYLFARGGGERSYNPLQDDPFNVPSFTMHNKALKKDPESFIKKVQLAKDGKVSVFCFHGVPDGEHPQVGLEPEAFKKMLKYLKDNDYNVIAMRDLAQYIDAQKAALYLHRPFLYPWGGRALSWGSVSQKKNTLYLGVDSLPTDRKLTLPGLTTEISKAWFLADTKEKSLPITVSDKGISTITVPNFSDLPANPANPANAQDGSPTVIVAELVNHPRATILDFIFPGLPQTTIEGNDIHIVVPQATDVSALAPVFKTGSPKVIGVPASGTMLDFTKPQKYSIQSSDGQIRMYTVTVTRKLGSANVTNPSFEIFDELNRDNGTLGISPQGSFWTFTPKHPGASIGIISLESPHLQALPPLDGSRRCGVLGGRGSSISQALMFDEGSYEISFDRTIPDRIPSIQFPSIDVLIDGKKIATLAAVNLTKGAKKLAWKRHTSSSFKVSDGLHQISFIVGEDANESNYGVRETNLIDNVRIRFLGK